jgi:hypothetical protein
MHESRYGRPVNTRCLLFLAVSLGLGSGLGTASCGPTCPASEPNCGTGTYGSIAGAAGAAGASSSATCDALTALKSCMSSFCATAALTNPFCKCYKNGFDLSTASCLCVDFSPKKFCDDQAASGVTFDCSSQVGAVGTACVGVE